MIDAFVTYIQAEKRYSPLTVRNYRHDIELFLSWCALNAGISPENLDIKSITAEDIREVAQRYLVLEEEAEICIMPEDAMEE